jgi:hypothetical protein
LPIHDDDYYDHDHHDDYDHDHYDHDHHDDYDHDHDYNHDHDDRHHDHDHPSCDAPGSGANDQQERRLDMDVCHRLH